MNVIEHTAAYLTVVCNKKSGMKLNAFPDQATTSK